MILVNPYALATGGGGGAVSARYWRITNLSVTNSAYLELSEVQLLSGATVVSSGKTYSTNPALTGSSGGGLNDLFDGNLTTRAYWTKADAVSGGFYLKVDLGSPMVVDGVKQGGFDDSERYMNAFTLEYSDNDASWTALGSKSGLTYPGNNTLSSTYSFP